MRDANRKIPILIVTDCEPDLRETIPGEPDPWIGFERLFAFMSEKRLVIAERTGAPAHFSWFWRMDPQIAFTYGSTDWAVRAYASQMVEAKRCGDEAGAHAHVHRWDAALGRWIADLANDALVESCVRGALSAFERSFGEPCRIFSFGDGWHNQASVRLIEQLGIRIDLTLEPGCDGASLRAPEELSTGVPPDLRGIPAQPYRPSAANFLKPDSKGATQLWFLPMTTGVAPRPQANHRTGFFARLTAAKPEMVKLNLGFEPERFMPIFDRAMSAGPRPYVAIALRTDVGSNEGLLRYAETNLQNMLNHRRADRFVFMAPTEALALLTN